MSVRSSATPSAPSSNDLDGHDEFLGGTGFVAPGRRSAPPAEGAHASAVAGLAKAAHARGVAVLGRGSWLLVALAAFAGMAPFSACGSPPPPEAAGLDEKLECNDSMPYFIRAEDTGFADCKGTGLKHRVHATVCPTFLPRKAREVQQAIGYDPAAADSLECQSDEDCKEKINGECKLGQPNKGSFCSYGCRADADCAADELCLCDYPVGRCVHALCRSDEDCTGSAVCGEYVPKSDCNDAAYACQTPEDQCASRSCWDSGTGTPTFCTLSEKRRRFCSKDVTCVKI